MDKYYTIEEVSKILRIAPYTARKWVKQGFLKAKRVRRRLLIYDLNESLYEYNKKNVEKKEDLQVAENLPVKTESPPAVPPSIAEAFSSDDTIL